MVEFYPQREVLEIAPYKSLKHCVFSLNTLEERRIQQETFREEYGNFLHKKLAPIRAGILASLFLFSGLTLYSERQNISNSVNNLTQSIYQQYEKIVDFPNSLLRENRRNRDFLE